MFNLLVKSSPWTGGTATFGTDRVLSLTEDSLTKKFSPGGTLDFDALTKLPTLFVEETNRDANQVARIGKVINVSLQRHQYVIQYLLDGDARPIPQSELIKLAPQLNIDIPRRGFDELSTTHWAVKNADLFQALYNSPSTNTRMPKVFNVPKNQAIEKDLISVMMPFAGFDAVYDAIKTAAKLANMRCTRADEIWENPTIIQDIASLIDRAAIVVCDCTKKNANVFYELGVAHALGKEVILIAQHETDIPFDVVHHRYIVYHNNAEGLEKLAGIIAGRVNTLRMV